MSIARLTHADGVASVANGVTSLDRDGAVIFHNLADEACIATLSSELEPYLTRTPPGEGLFFGRHTRRMGRLLMKSATARALAVHPLVLGIADTILGRHCSRIQISLSQAISIDPGEKAQILHRDDEFYPIDKGGAEFMLNAMWALSDFTHENGATRLVPGSHRQPVTRDVPASAVQFADMTSGSLLVYLGSMTHAGGANLTNAPRVGVVFSYCLGWLRQAENQYLAYPPAVAKGFPRELQRLIGYAVHEPNLGWYEGQDPRILLSDDTSEFLAAQDNVSAETAAAIELRYRETSGA